MSHESNDYRVTAYVFGELLPAETDAFERELEQSAELQREVNAIRETVDAVKAELAGETFGVGDAGRRRIEGVIAGTLPDSATDETVSLPLPTKETTHRTMLLGIAIAATVLLLGSLAIPAFMQPTGVAVNDDKLGQSEKELSRLSERSVQYEQAADESSEPSERVQREDRGSESRGSESRARFVQGVPKPDLSEIADFGFLNKTGAGSERQPQSESKRDAYGTTPGNGAVQQSGGSAGGSRQYASRDVSGAAADSNSAAGDANSGFGVVAPNTSDLSVVDGKLGSDQSGQNSATMPDNRGGVAGPGAKDGITGQSNAPAGYRSTTELYFTVPTDASPADAPAPVALKPSTVPVRHADRSPAQTSGSVAGGVINDFDTEQRNLEEQLVPLQIRRESLSAEFGQDHPAVRSITTEIESKRKNVEASKKRMLQIRLGSIIEKSKAPAAPDTSFGRELGTSAITSRDRRANVPELENADRLQAELQVEVPVGDRHDPITDNPFMHAIDSPLSTFSIDVDTAAYAKVRMYLMQQNSLPRPNAVRIEELLNYFTYDYTPPSDEHPFAATVAVAQCPWNPDHRLARVALKGKVIEENRPASNLVFLLDVSGSMNKPNKHPFVVEGMKLLTRQLTENDQVAIVVYAGAAGMVLDSTCGDDKETILSSLDRLRAGGSTNGAQGIQLAYETARDNFIVGGTNRVILCTDGDFNVGVTNTNELVKIAEENAKGNIFLSVLGFGMGNHNDAMMEQISNKGNGNYAFIDSKREAQKVLVEQMGGTLVTIAKDVKIQIEFNPSEVAAYRLIGYENRVLAAQDFNDDTKDAGEIGAGHTVTALYELVPAKGEIGVDVPEIDDLRYRKKAKLSREAGSGELLELKLRYKQPTGTKSTLIRTAVKDEGKSFAEMDKDFKFAASVAAFGMMLRNSPHKGNTTFAGIEEMVPEGIGQDKSGRRTEFLQMVTKAKALSGEK